MNFDSLQISVSIRTVQLLSDGLKTILQIWGPYTVYRVFFDILLYTVGKELSNFYRAYQKLIW